MKDIPYIYTPNLFLEVLARPRLVDAILLLCFAYTLYMLAQSYHEYRVTSTFP